MTDKTPHDIVMEAIDLIGKDVRILVQVRNGVVVYQGTVSGYAEMGDTASVTLDDCHLARGVTIADHMLFDAKDVIDIEGTS